MKEGLEILGFVEVDGGKGVEAGQVDEEGVGDCWVCGDGW